MASQLKEENEIKIFILYLLDKIGYPLDYPSIGSIMMQDGIVNFFDFAQCFFALVDAGHIREIVLEDDNDNAENTVASDEEEDVEPGATVLYEVTDTGREVARVLSDNLMVAVREKGYRSALRHLSFAKKGAYINHSYKPDGEGYLINCSIKQKSGVLLDLNIHADSEYQLKRMLDNFSERPEVIFRGIVALLSGDVNYLFEQ
ncbi:MAG: DUF4364 family protein [Clostridia bacterium]|nr:DUF4364 family protein [Clostridia bacterium]